MFHTIHSGILFVVAFLFSMATKSTEHCLGNKPKVSLSSDFFPSVVSSIPFSSPAAVNILGENVKWYKVKTGSCTPDGLKVDSDFHVGTLLSYGGYGEVCPNGVETSADVFIELNDDGLLGIRANTTSCLKTALVEDHFNEAGQFGNISGVGSMGRQVVTVFRHSVRIEDQGGWLVEKFIFKILQNMDLLAVWNEARFAQVQADGEDDKDTKSGNYTKGTDSTAQTLKWGCQPQESLVSMDPGFSPITIATTPTSSSSNADSSCSPEGICPNPPASCPSSSCCLLPSNSNSPSYFARPTSNCGCYDNSTGTCIKMSSFGSEWGGCSEDGMKVNSMVFMDHSSHFDGKQCGQTGEDNEGGNTAQVLLKFTAHEWALSVSVSQCINTNNDNIGQQRHIHQSPDIKQRSKGFGWSAGPPSSSPSNKFGPVHFTASMDITEGSIYQRLLQVSRKYVQKNIKSGKLAEILERRYKMQGINGALGLDSKQN